MPDSQLETLEAKGLIRLAALQPELEYLFRHALVQDAAYESLLKQERRSLHRSVGEALEQLYPDRRGEMASMLAMHFEHSGDAERAIPYLVEAARYAYARNAIVEAFELYTRAGDLLPPTAGDEDEDMRRLRIEIGFGRVKAGFSFLQDQTQIDALEPLLEQVEGLGDRRLAAEIHLHAALLRQFSGERPETSPPLKRSLDRVEQLAAELNDPEIASIPKSIIGMFQVFTGELQPGVENLEEGAAALEGKHAFIGSSFALVALAIGLARLGRFEEASDAAARASRIAQSGDLIARLDGLIGESTVRSIRGDLEGAIPLARQCTTLSEETGATACVVASNFLLGDAYMRQGKFGSAKIAFERSNEVATTFQEKSFRPSLAAYMRSIAAVTGELPEGIISFAEALELAEKNGDKWNVANVLWKRAEARGEGNDAQALADYETSTRLFEQMGARPFVARTLRGWGEALRAAGKGEEGDAKLRRALALFEEMGIDREAEELRELLPA